MRSLFVISLPRCLSSMIVHHASSALGLWTPGWTSAGEILNNDRWFGGRRASADEEKFMPPEQRFAMEQQFEFLSDVVSDEGRCYKDVVQPFAVSAWLRGRGLAVLRIERPLADVACAMERCGWDYPKNAALHDGGHPDAWLRGLVRADAALREVPAVTISFDELIGNEAVVAEALRSLYPQEKIGPLRYIDADFRQQSEQVLASRATPLWAELEDRLRHIEPVPAGTDT